MGFIQWSYFLLFVSPAKKAAVPEPTTTPETKAKRHWELWSCEDKDTFFEGLCEVSSSYSSANITAGILITLWVVPYLLYHHVWENPSEYKGLSKYHTISHNAMQ